MKVLTALLLALVPASVALAEPIRMRPCRSDTRVTGACFWVHGRLNFGNGNPSLRMWRVGTKRYLGILDDEDAIVPANLATCLLPTTGETGFERTTFGDFMVCPFTPERSGWMRMVCIESARNIIVQDVIAGPNGPIDGPARPCGRHSRER